MSIKLSKDYIKVYFISAIFLGAIFWLFYQVYKVYNEASELDETWVESVGTNLRPFSGRSSANIF